MIISGLSHTDTANTLSQRDKAGRSNLNTCYAERDMFNSHFQVPMGLCPAHLPEVNGLLRTESDLPSFSLPDRLE